MEFCPAGVSACFWFLFVVLDAPPALLSTPGALKSQFCREGLPPPPESLADVSPGQSLCSCLSFCLAEWKQKCRYPHTPTIYILRRSPPSVGILRKERNQGLHLHSWISVLAYKPFIFYCPHHIHKHPTNYGIICHCTDDGKDVNCQKFLPSLYCPRKFLLQPHFWQC